MSSLYEINADCCWGDTCQADFWGIWEDDDPDGLEWCEKCTKRCYRLEERRNAVLMRELRAKR